VHMFVYNKELSNNIHGTNIKKYIPYYAEEATAEQNTFVQ